MTLEPIIYVVDDDDESCMSVCAVVRSMGVRAESFPSAELFLDNHQREQPGCLVSDVRMPGMSGLELQEQLQERRIFLPMILMTAYARVPMTVQAMRRGAVTLLEKPCKENELWKAIRDALQRDASRRMEFESRDTCRRRLATLSAEQREVLRLVIDGLPNKAIAKRLDKSIRTVEGRRSAIYRKTRVDSVAQLVRLVMIAEPDAVSE